MFGKIFFFVIAFRHIFGMDLEMMREEIAKEDAFLTELLNLEAAPKGACPIRRVCYLGHFQHDHRIANNWRTCGQKCYEPMNYCTHWSFEPQTNICFFYNFRASPMRINPNNSKC